MCAGNTTDICLEQVVSRVRGHPDVVALYLAGSVAACQATPLSDIDLAVWLKPCSTRSQRFHVQLELLHQLTQTLGRDDVDLVVLNDAAPVVRYHLLRGAKRLYVQDEEQRVALEARAIKMYLDLVPSLRVHQQALKERIRTGRFAGHA